MPKTKILQIIEFIQACEKLKTELRKSYTSDPTRRESVADHTWMNSLIAVCLFEEIKVEVDQLKTLKMIIIHDLVEVFAGDIAVWDKVEQHQYYFQKEETALYKLLEFLPDNPKLANEILSLWQEFEKLETNEAKLARAIDKSEVLLQYNAADIQSWNPKAYKYALREGFFDFDPIIRLWKDEIDKQTIAKVTKADKTELLNPSDLDNFNNRTKNIKKPKISIIAAISTNRVIGKNGRLPWNIPSDMQRMKTITLGHPIIMGRKTFESIGKPLPGRTNIIITSQPDYKVNGAIIVNSLQKAIQEAQKTEQDEIFIFGGGEIYTLAMPVVQKLYLTVVEGDFEGDAFFPEYSKFNKIILQQKHQENGYKFTFLDLERTV